MVRVWDGGASRIPHPTILCMFWWSSFTAAEDRLIFRDRMTWIAGLWASALAFVAMWISRWAAGLTWTQRPWCHSRVTAGMVLVEMPRAGMDRIPLRFAAKDIWRVGPNPDIVEVSLRPHPPAPKTMYPLVYVCSPRRGNSMH